MAFDAHECWSPTHCPSLLPGKRNALPAVDGSGHRWDQSGSFKKKKKAKQKNVQWSAALNVGFRTFHHPEREILHPLTVPSRVFPIYHFQLLATMDLLLLYIHLLWQSFHTNRILCSVDRGECLYPQCVPKVNLLAMWVTPPS